MKIHGAKGRPGSNRQRRKREQEMNKRAHHFSKIQEYKERFSKQTTQALSARLNNHRLIKEAAIAAREILRERGISDTASTKTSN